MKIPKLSFRGDMTDAGNPQATFDWADAIADAAILSGIGFLAALGGTSVAGLPSGQALYAAVIAAGVQFLTILGLKRNILKEG